MNRTVRRVTEAPPEALVEIVQANDEAMLGHVRSDARDLEDWWRRSDLANDSWVFEEDGRVVAFAWMQIRGDIASAAGFVHPQAYGRGLGTELAELAEQRAVELGQGMVHQWTYADDLAARRLFESRGYREVRRFWEMGIELDAPPPEPVLPDGVAIETLGENDARGFYAADEEAFAEHWGHVDTPFEEWWERQARGKGFDPTLWFLIRDGDEIAAICMCEAGRRAGGLVAALGVRKAWRQRGFGLALLHHSFGELYRRGESRVTLGVDSDNETGATRLYERAGMSVEMAIAVFGRELP